MSKEEGGHIHHQAKKSKVEAEVASINALEQLKLFTVVVGN